MKHFIIIEEIELKKNKLRDMSKLLDSELIDITLQEIADLERELTGRTI